MSNITSDFEKYPKYHLDKHGKIIQQILDTADTVFGMAPSSEEVVGFKQTVTGAQHLLNDAGSRAVFTDDFHIDLEKGQVSLGSAVDTKLALANYATDADIKAIFTEVDTGDDVITPEQLPTPIAVFSTDASAVSVTDEEGTPVDTDFYYTVETETLGIALEIQDSFQKEIELPELPKLPCIQKITVICPGDDIFTLDSEAATLYRICAGIPELSVNSSNIFEIQPLTAVNPLDPKAVLFNSADVSHEVRYTLLSYDYDEKVESSTSNSLTTEAVIVTLHPGDTLEATIATTINDLTSTEEYTPIFTAENTRIVPAVVRYSNLRQLNRPAIEYNSALKTVTLTHSNIDGTSDVSKLFVCGIRRVTDNNWQDISDYIISPVDPDAGDLVTSLTLDVSHLSTGDSIRVKSVAQHYADSPYAYFTLTNTTPSTPSDPVEPAVNVIDSVASGILTSEKYDFNNYDWNLSKPKQV